MTRPRICVLPITLAFVLWISSVAAHAQSFAGVLTYHNDDARTGQNLAETVLTPANVNAASFGKLRQWKVDGYVYAQPLYVLHVRVRHRMRDLVLIATEHDSVYAFDPDSRGKLPIWHKSFLSKKDDVTTVPSLLLSSFDIVPEVGITSTPVVDPAAGTIFVVAKTLEQGTNIVLRLHALEITTGLERPGSPVVLSATVPGYGAGNSGGTVTYDDKTSNQRSALALVDGVVYVANASHGDIPPYHGWILGYDETSLAQVAVFNDTPNGSNGGIWMSGSGPAADSGGNLFVSTGNGTFDAASGGIDYGDSFLKLNRSGGSLHVADYFTPWNQAYLNDNDLDLGSGGLILLPDQAGDAPHEVIGGGKAGAIYVVKRDAMGGYDTASESNSQIVQEIDDQTGAMLSCPAYFNGYVYFGGVDSPVTQFQLNDGLLSGTPIHSTSSRTFGFPGTTPAISANGTSNPILWTIESDTFGAPFGHATLYAFDANDISIELYDSGQAGARDLPGPAVKFTVPTIASGKVLVGGQYSVTEYGLLDAKGKPRR